MKKWLPFGINKIGGGISELQQFYLIEEAEHAKDRKGSIFNAKVCGIDEDHTRLLIARVEDFMGEAVVLVYETEGKRSNRTVRMNCLHNLKVPAGYFRLMLAKDFNSGTAVPMGKYTVWQALSWLDGKDVSIERERGHVCGLSAEVLCRYAEMSNPFNQQAFIDLYKRYDDSEQIKAFKRKHKGERLISDIMYTTTSYNIMQGKSKERRANSYEDFKRIDGIHGINKYYEIITPNVYNNIMDESICEYDCSDMLRLTVYDFVDYFETLCCGDDKKAFRRDFLLLSPYEEITVNGMIAALRRRYNSLVGLKGMEYDRSALEERRRNGRYWTMYCYDLDEESYRQAEEEKKAKMLASNKRYQENLLAESEARMKRLKQQLPPIETIVADRIAYFNDQVSSECKAYIATWKEKKTNEYIKRIAKYEFDPLNNKYSDYTCNYLSGVLGKIAQESINSIDSVLFNAYKKFKTEKLWEALDNSKWNKSISEFIGVDCLERRIRAELYYAFIDYTKEYVKELEKEHLRAEEEQMLFYESNLKNYIAHNDCPGHNNLPAHNDLVSQFYTKQNPDTYELAYEHIDICYPIPNPYDLYGRDYGDINDIYDLELYGNTALNVADIYARERLIQLQARFATEDELYGKDYIDITKILAEESYKTDLKLYIEPYEKEQPVWAEEFKSKYWIWQRNHWYYCDIRIYDDYFWTSKYYIRYAEYCDYFSHCNNDEQFYGKYDIDADRELCLERLRIERINHIEPYERENCVWQAKLEKEFSESNAIKWLYYNTGSRRRQYDKYFKANAEYCEYFVYNCDEGFYGGYNIDAYVELCLERRKTERKNHIGPYEKELNSRYERRLLDAIFNNEYSECVEYLEDYEPCDYFAHIDEYYFDAGNIYIFNDEQRYIDDYETYGKPYEKELNKLYNRMKHVVLSEAPSSTPFRGIRGSILNYEYCEYFANDIYGNTLGELRDRGFHRRLCQYANLISEFKNVSVLDSNYDVQLHKTP